MKHVACAVVLGALVQSAPVDAQSIFAGSVSVAKAEVIRTYAQGCATVVTTNADGPSLALTPGVYRPVFVGTAKLAHPGAGADGSDGPAASVVSMEIRDASTSAVLTQSLKTLGEKINGLQTSTQTDTPLGYVVVTEPTSIFVRSWASAQCGTASVDGLLVFERIHAF